jgi:hypothetical protein
MWLKKRIKGLFTKKPRNSDSESRLDPNDNQYRRAKFGMKAAGGLNGPLMRRASNFTDPTPLDEEEF